MLPSSGVCSTHSTSDGWKNRLYTGTLINDLFAVVERAEAANRKPHARDSRLPCSCGKSEIRGSKKSESEEFSQPLGLGAADGNLGLLLVVHAQLVGTLEPGHNFADTVDVHQVGTMRAPE